MQTKSRTLQTFKRVVDSSDDTKPVQIYSDKRSQVHPVKPSGDKSKEVTTDNAEKADKADASSSKNPVAAKSRPPPQKPGLQV